MKYFFSLYFLLFTLGVSAQFIQQIKQRAEAGDPVAQNELGWDYLEKARDQGYPSLAFIGNSEEKNYKHIRTDAQKGRFI